MPRPSRDGAKFARWRPRHPHDAWSYRFTSPSATVSVLGSSPGDMRGGGAILGQFPWPAMRLRIGRNRSTNWTPSPFCSSRDSCSPLAGFSAAFGARWTFGRSVSRRMSAIAPRSKLRAASHRLPQPDAQRAHRRTADHPRMGPVRPDADGDTPRFVLDGNPAPRVLVVDDEPSIAELLSIALRDEGWDVRTAGNGADALAAAEEFRPDAVILDVMLPDLDGPEVLRRLRAEKPQLPVLFLTARDDAADRIAALTAGGSHYLTKPFSLGEVAERLRGVLPRSSRPMPDGGSLVVGDLVLDEETRDVSRGGRQIHLTASEFEPLRCLPDASPGPGGVQDADHRPRLAVPDRRPGRHRGPLHLLPAPQDRPRPRADDSHRQGRGVSARAQLRLTIIPRQSPGSCPRRQGPLRQGRAPAPRVHRVVPGMHDERSQPRRRSRRTSVSQRCHGGPKARPGILRV